MWGDGGVTFQKILGALFSRRIPRDKAGSTVFPLHLEKPLTVDVSEKDLSICVTTGRELVQHAFVFDPQRANYPPNTTE